MIRNVIMWTGVPFAIVLSSLFAVGLFLELIKFAKILWVENEIYKRSKEFNRLAWMSYKLSGESLIMLHAATTIEDIKNSSGTYRIAQAAMRRGNRLMKDVYYGRVTK